MVFIDMASFKKYMKEGIFLNSEVDPQIDDLIKVL